MAADIDPAKYVFHVTPARNVKSILKNGLCPRIGPRSRLAGEQTEQTYFFSTALALEDGLDNWLLDVFDEDEKLAVLAVHHAEMTDLTSTHGAEFECTTQQHVQGSKVLVVTSDIDEAALKHLITTTFRSDGEVMAAPAASASTTPGLRR